MGKNIYEVVYYEEDKKDEGKGEKYYSSAYVYANSKQNAKEVFEKKTDKVPNYFSSNVDVTITGTKQIDKRDNWVYKDSVL